MTAAPCPFGDRAYQREAADAVFRRWDEAGDAATLLVLPTGTGKTVVAGMIARRLRDAGRGKMLFIAHREELVNQAVERLGDFGLECAVEMAGLHARNGHSLLGGPDVVVGTVQSLQGDRLASWPRDHFAVVCTDEAHHARADSYGALRAHFDAARHLGITATPDRGDRRNLGAVYDSVAYEYSLRQAIADTWLVPLIAARLETGVDLRNIRTSRGDFNQGDLVERISPHIEPLADALAREMGDRPTVAFTPDVNSAEMMADALDKKGKPASDISGRMSPHDRHEVLDRFRAGDLSALCCCDLLTEGWDCPRVACVAICRPTRKRNRYAQMVGRGTRPHPASGKADCLILDFAWETTAGHELVTATDLFDDSGDDEVRARARDLLDSGASADPAEAVDRAERQLLAARKLRVRLTGRVVAYRKTVYDPVGLAALLGLPGPGPAAPAATAFAGQVDMLGRLGVAVPDAAGLDRREATDRINLLLSRNRAGLATLPQVARLQGLGVDPAQSRTLGRADAGRILDALEPQAPPDGD